MVEKGKKITLVKEILQEKYKIMENSKGTKKKKEKVPDYKKLKRNKNLPTWAWENPWLATQGDIHKYFCTLEHGKIPNSATQGGIKKQDVHLE